MKRRITPHGHKRDCRYFKGGNCNCMTVAQRQRYLAWLESECARIRGEVDVKA